MFVKEVHTKITLYILEEYFGKSKEIHDHNSRHSTRPSLNPNQPKTNLYPVFIQCHISNPYMEQYAELNSQDPSLGHQSCNYKTYQNFLCQQLLIFTKYKNNSTKLFLTYEIYFTKLYPVYSNLKATNTDYQIFVWKVR